MQAANNRQIKMCFCIQLGLATSWNLPLFLYARYDPVSEFCLFQWPTTGFAEVHSPLCALFYGVLPISIMSYAGLQAVVSSFGYLDHGPTKQATLH